MIVSLGGRPRDLGYALEVDPSGNVVRLDGRTSERPLHCLAADMDEIGLTVAAVGVDGSLRVERLGGTLLWKLGETAVEILGDRESVVGAISMGSGDSRAQAAQCPGWEAVRVLTGLSTQRLAEAGIRVGTPIVPARGTRGPFMSGNAANPWVAAWTFDNRLSVAASSRPSRESARTTLSRDS